MKHIVTTTYEIVVTAQVEVDEPVGGTVQDLDVLHVTVNGREVKKYVLDTTDILGFPERGAVSIWTVEKWEDSLTGRGKLTLELERELR